MCLKTDLLQLHFSAPCMLDSWPLADGHTIVNPSAFTQQVLIEGVLRAESDIFALPCWHYPWLLFHVSYHSQLIPLLKSVDMATCLNMKNNWI